MKSIKPFRATKYVAGDQLLFLKGEQLPDSGLVLEVVGIYDGFTRVRYPSGNLITHKTEALAKHPCVFLMTDASLLDEIATALGGAYSEEGKTQWWNRTRTELGNRTPQQAWDDGERGAVLSLARSLNSGGGT